MPKNTFKVRFSYKQTYFINNYDKICRSWSLFDIGGLLFACIICLIIKMSFSVRAMLMMMNDDVYDIIIIILLGL